VVTCSKWATRIIRTTCTCRATRPAVRSTCWAAPRRWTASEGSGAHAQHTEHRVQLPPLPRRRSNESVHFCGFKREHCATKEFFLIYWRQRRSLQLYFEELKMLCRGPRIIYYYYTCIPWEWRAERREKTTHLEIGQLFRPQKFS
jgi:hypothetical protein